MSCETSAYMASKCRVTCGLCHLSPPPPRLSVRQRIDEINARFHRAPFGEWGSGGTLVDAGVMVHCIDGWEQGWTPKFSALATSLIFSQNGFPGAKVPVFNSNGGLVLRPGLARVLCGKHRDGQAKGGGHCVEEVCDAPVLKRGEWTVAAARTWSDRGPAVCQWRPEDLGPYLRAVTDWQVAWKRPLPHNEIIVEAHSFEASLPRSVEAFFVHVHGSPVAARDLHAEFLATYALDEEDCPLVQFDPDNWATPFQSYSGDGGSQGSRARKR